MTGNPNIAYFGSGDFHISEAVFKCIKGVKETTVGYTGGTGKPTFDDVENGIKDHTKVVQIIYDPD